MELFDITLIIIFCVLLIAIYDEYRPKIDIVTSRNKYIVLLWYNKWYWNGECKKTYIKLFEI